MDKGRIEHFAVDMNITFVEFLDFIKVCKMLYGRDVAERLFTKGLSQMYNVDSASLSKLFVKDNR